MEKEMEFLFDYGSPFSYLSSLQLEGFARRNSAATVSFAPDMCRDQVSNRGLDRTVAIKR